MLSQGANPAIRFPQVSMRILVVQNFEKTGLGQIGRALGEAGAEVETVMAHRGEGLPDGPGGHDGLIVLGGGQNALDDENHPYLPKLAGLMRDFALADRAVLGVCLGSQLLARGMGATNLIGAAPEFGWREVRLTAEGQADPVLRAVPEAFPIFQWHDDTFSLPAGAIRLAGNEAAENQAFRVGRAGYGVQFHFEADRGLVRQWNADFSDYLAQRQPGWPERFEAEAARNGPAADAAGIAIARAWVAMV
jgi:GMP synthase-like glutamine amidotransferase